MYSVKQTMLFPIVVTCASVRLSSFSELEFKKQTCVITPDITLL